MRARGEGPEGERSRSAPLSQSISGTRASLSFCSLVRELTCASSLLSRPGSAAHGSRLVYRAPTRSSDVKFALRAALSIDKAQCIPPEAQFICDF